MSDAVDSCPVSATRDEQGEAPVDDLAFVADAMGASDADQVFFLGLCHAWVAASILEPQPRLDVAVDTGTLTAEELERLLDISFTTTLGRVAGSACSIEVGDDTLTIDEDGFILDPMSHAPGDDTLDIDEDGFIEEPSFCAVCDGLTIDEDGFVEEPFDYERASELSVDEDGFITEPECYDDNAGTFHVLLGNLVGLQGQSFALDRATSGLLELAPVLGYAQVIESDLAIEDLCGRLDLAGWNLLDLDAASFAWVETTVTLLDPAVEGGTSTETWTYALELDATGAITGGTWGACGLATAPDFFLLPLSGAAEIGGLDLTTLAAFADLATDRDDDGVVDALDACPTEYAADADADENGCTDLVQDLPALVISLGLEASAGSALLASANAAVASAARGSTTSSVNQLAAFSAKVSAQAGKRIGTGDAALLLAFAANAAAAIER